MKMRIAGIKMFYSSVIGAINDISYSRPSHSTNKPVEVWRSPEQGNVLFDGYHRVAEALLSGGTSVNVKFIGHVNPDYLRVPTEDQRFHWQPTEFGGLEKYINLQSLRELRFLIVNRRRDERKTFKQWASEPA